MAGDGIASKAFVHYSGREHRARNRRLSCEPARNGHLLGTGRSEIQMRAKGTQAKAPVFGEPLRSLLPHGMQFAM